MNVLVTSGTGTLGRQVVMQLRQPGHRARILSRNPKGHVDIVQGVFATGVWLLLALSGMDAIIHAASGDHRTLESTCDRCGWHPPAAHACAQTQRSCTWCLSRLSVWRVSGHPYYKTKLAAEAVVREGIAPWSILRATQFQTSGPATSLRVTRGARLQEHRAFVACCPEIPEAPGQLVTSIQVQLAFCGGTVALSGVGSRGQRNTS